MPYCTSCGNEISASDRFCTHCGKPVAQSTSYTATTSPSQQPQSEPTPPHSHSFAHGHEIPCPSCGRSSDYIKSFTMFKECLFLICYTRWRMVNYTCCPDCMRKKILDEGIFTSKIITANFLWLFCILPLAIIQLFLCNQKGHSKSVLE